MFPTFSWFQIGKRGKSRYCLKTYMDPKYHGHPSKITSGSPKTFPPDAPPDVSRGNSSVCPPNVCCKAQRIYVSSLSFFHVTLGRMDRMEFGLKRTWEKWRFFSPRKMNGWNLRIHPWEKGKSSEPKHHFQVLHVNLRGCKVIQQQFNFIIFIIFIQVYLHVFFGASLNLKGPFSLPNKCLLRWTVVWMVCLWGPNTYFFGASNFFHHVNSVSDTNMSFS